MNSDPNCEPPFFMKPADVPLLNDADMPYSQASKDLHHEMGLVVALGKGGHRYFRTSRALPCLGLPRRPRYAPA